MELQQIREIMLANPYEKYWMLDGKKQKMFFSETYNCVCFYDKGKKRYGTPVNRDVYSTWQTLSLPKKEDEYLLLYKRLKKIADTLNKSGFWSDTIGKSTNTLYNLGFDKFVEYINLEYDKRKEFEEEHDCRLGIDCLKATLRRGIKTINTYKYDTIKKEIESAVENGNKYRRAWRKGYDNSVEYNPDGKRGWYSEEYKNCGNGHYYFLIDPTHAVFGEDD